MSSETQPDDLVDCVVIGARTRGAVRGAEPRPGRCDGRADRHGQAAQCRDPALARLPEPGRHPTPRTAQARRRGTARVSARPDPRARDRHASGPRGARIASVLRRRRLARTRRGLAAGCAHSAAGDRAAGDTARGRRSSLVLRHERVQLCRLRRLGTARPPARPDRRDRGPSARAPCTCRAGRIR